MTILEFLESKEKMAIYCTTKAQSNIIHDFDIINRNVDEDCACWRVNASASKDDKFMSSDTKIIKFEDIDFSKDKNMLYQSIHNTIDELLDKITIVIKGTKND